MSRADVFLATQTAFPRNNSATRAPSRYSCSQLNSRECRECRRGIRALLIPSAEIAAPRALSNRLVDEPKVLLSRKGHQEYASAPSSRFTFSSLVHLLLLHGICRSQVFEPAIGTAWPPCRFQSPPGRRQVQRLSPY